MREELRDALLESVTEGADAEGVRATAVLDVLIEGADTDGL